MITEKEFIEQVGLEKLKCFTQIYYILRKDNKIDSLDDEKFARLPLYHLLIHPDKIKKKDGSIIFRGEVIDYDRFFKKVTMKPCQNTKCNSYEDFPSIRYNCWRWKYDIDFKLEECKNYKE